MKEFKKVVIRKEDIDFSLEERNGHFVYLPSRTTSGQLPVGCILQTLNGQHVLNCGLHLSGIRDYMSSPDHYPLSLVFRLEQGLQELKGRKRLTYPVPHDFFGEIPPLTQEEIKHYTNLAQSWAKGLLDASISDEGFDYVCSRNDVDIYQGTRPGSQIHLIRGVTRVKSSRDEARALMIAPTTESFRRLFHMIGCGDSLTSAMVYLQNCLKLPQNPKATLFKNDGSFQDGLVLHQFPAGYKVPEFPFYSIKWAVMGSPIASPVWDRDVCWLEYGDITHDEAGRELGFGVGASVTRPECPTLENHKLVRAEISYTGYVFKERDNDPGYMDVIHVIQGDPKGWIPKWVVNMVAVRQALNVARIKQMIEGTLEAKERMSHHRRNNAEIQSVVVPNQQRHKVYIKVTEPNSQILFGFCSNHHDIGCYVSGLPEGKEWSESKRFDSHVKPVSGQVLVADAGEYALVFDNYYSWFKSKQVYYWYRVDSIGN